MIDIDQVEKIVMDVLISHEKELREKAESLMESAIEVYSAPEIAVELTQKIRSLEGKTDVSATEVKDLRDRFLRAKVMSQHDYLEVTNRYRVAEIQAFEFETAVSYLKRSFYLAKLEAVS